METKDGGTDRGGRRTFFYFHQLLRTESEGDKTSRSLKCRTLLLEPSKLNLMHIDI